MLSNTCLITVYAFNNHVQQAFHFYNSSKYTDIGVFGTGYVGYYIVKIDMSLRLLTKFVYRWIVENHKTKHVFYFELFQRKALYKY